MATGVLVVLVGEATKLEPYLSAADKAYDATISFGRATDTLDARGETTAEAPLPEGLADELARLEPAPSGGALDAGAWELRERAPLLAAAIGAELARAEQVPPRFSAIKVEGRKGYDRARSGEAFELAPRAVRLLAAAIARARRDPPLVSLSITVSKGYYVRALARDLGERLAVPAHLSALRRTRSGGASLDDAVTLETGREELLSRLVSVEVAARAALPVGVLNEAGVLRAVRGQALLPSDFASGQLVAGAWLDESGALVAIGEIEGAVGRVRRGFVRAAART
jgi:tRNA pseudouridine55 synthase